ncbi:C-signal-like [Glandiceps talaboti]
MASALEVRSVLITGTDTGNGLEMVRQFAKLQNPPDYVFAAALSPETAEELKQVANDNPNVTVLKMDVTNLAEIDEAAKQVEQRVGKAGLNLLINNAGYAGKHEDKMEDVTVEAMMMHYRINTIGPAMVAKRFLPLLREASKSVGGDGMSASRAAIFSVSSRVASLDDNTSGKLYSYRCSKLALNMITKNLSLELASDNILSVSLHPGSVKTAMGGPNPLITSEESVRSLINVMATRTKEHNGSFYDQKGLVIKW